MTHQTNSVVLEWNPADLNSVRDACGLVRDQFGQLRAEVGRVIVGQQKVVDETLVALFAGGHVLLEGVPGLGKTLLVQTIAQALDLDFARIQFTPDVMPADITGTTIVMEHETSHRREIVFRPGPIFHQLVLADEINRATPKSQSALLEAMQERTVTSGGETRALPDPFFVLATQNPIEQEGTYPLPEAQLDRFLFKVEVPGVSRADLNEIISRTTGQSQPGARRRLDGVFLKSARRLMREAIVAPHVQDYAIRLILATHPTHELFPESLNRHVQMGASPRGAQSLISAAKVLAVADGRYAASTEDVRRVAPAALRHRIGLTFEAGTDRVTGSEIVSTLLREVPVNIPLEQEDVLGGAA
ncbi:MAG: AAA family ATPase [Phycisphaerales bacterium]|nr:AAA family ATPase [Phycisphaerales bacterium]